jgi:hypothetical protein
MVVTEEEAAVAKEKWVAVRERVVAVTKGEQVVVKVGVKVESEAINMERVKVESEAVNMESMV